MNGDFYCDSLPIERKGPHPNTALLSAILMFGCFFIAYFLRLFRNSPYLGRNARRALGDFGVPIAIVIMVLIDYSAGDTFTEKLNVPDGLAVTNPNLRNWTISPFGGMLFNVTGRTEIQYIVQSIFGVLYRIG